MENIMESNRNRETTVEAYARWVIRWRWLIIVLSIVAAGLIASGAKNLWFATDYRTFFSKDNPQLTSFEALQNIYTKNDNILFVLEPRSGDVFTPEVLDAVEQLTQEAWKIPYTIRVDSPTNFQHTRAEEDDLIVENLVEDALARSPEELEAARQIALAEPRLYKRLIPAETNLIGVNATLQLPGESIEEVPKAVAYARNLAAEIESKYPDLKTYLTGIVMLNNAFSEAANKDFQTLIPLMYLSMLVVMFWVLRSLSGTFATLSIVTFSALIAMGLAGWLRVGLTPVSAQAPTMIMTLAIADSIHILVIMLREMRNGREKREAIVESLRLNMQPVFLTSLTTAIGFLSMNMSDAPPFRHLGNITAAGVGVAFVYSVVFLPALMAVLPVRMRKGQSPATARFDRFANFVIRRQKSLLWISAGIVVVLATFIARNKLNDQFVKYFDKRVQFRNDSDFVMDRLTGIYQLEFSIGAGESGGVSNPAYLKKLDEFERWYRGQSNVVQVNSFNEVMKRLNKSLHADDPTWYKIPDSRELAAQYLLLYELSLPYGLDLNNQVNVDKSATRFIVTLENISSREIRELAEKGERWLRENAPAYMSATGAGGAVMFSHISARNIKGMLRGTTIALVLISVVLIFALRSLKIGGLSLIPNLIPAMMAFGLWGILVGQINMALSVVSGMTLGIVVDDTVHFLSKYLRARREQGLTPPDAVRYAFASVGMAMFVTSVILIVGFGILSLSAFTLNGGMGRLTAITILLALSADFLFLPPILMKAEAKHGTETADRKTTEEALTAVD
jgi:uncharacterized protein